MAWAGTLGICNARHRSDARALNTEMNDWTWRFLSFELLILFLFFALIPNDPTSLTPFRPFATLNVAAQVKIASF